MHSRWTKNLFVPPLLSPERLFWIMALLAALLFRVVHLDSQGLWHDEMYTVAETRGADIYTFPGADLHPTEPARSAMYYQQLIGEGTFTDNFLRNVIHEGHPPAYMVATGIWTSAFGATPTTLRLFSTVCSVISILLLSLIARTCFGSTAGLAVISLAAFSPFSVYFGLEARSYALAQCLVLGAGLQTARMLKENSTSFGRAVRFTALGVMATLTHYYALPAVAVLALLLILSFGREQPIRIGSIAIAPAVLCAPWVVILAQQMSAHRGTHWTEGFRGFTHSALDAASAVPFLLSRSSSPLVLLPFIVFAATMLCLIAASKDRVDRRRLARDILLFLTMGMLFLVQVVGIDAVTAHHTSAVPRYSFPLWGLLLLVFGLLARAAARQFTKVTAIACCALSVYSLYLSDLQSRGLLYPKQMLREAAAYLSDNMMADEILLVTPSGPTLVGLAYYSRPDLMLRAEHPSSTVFSAPCTHADWIAVQRLGSHSALRMEPADPVSKYLDASKIVRFSGLDVVRLKCD